MKKLQIVMVTICLLILVASSFYSCVKEAGRAQVASLCDSVDIKYSDVILPMMQTHCATTNLCHNGGAGAAGPLDLNKYSDLKFFFDNGTLKTRVITLKDMPPPATPLPDSLIQQLNCWMAEGAQNN